jgi:hypothetical protein
MWLFIKKNMVTGRILYFYLFYFILTIGVSKFSFFWDTVQLASAHADFYYQNNLKISFLPDQIDSGHIPTFGYFLAIVWKIFGRSLIVSHLFMLPFLLGTVFQTYRLCRFLFPENSYLPMIVLLIEPTLLAQSTLVTPDIPLMFCYILLLNEILQRKNNYKLIAIIGLSLISMRGWMVAFIFCVFELISLFINSDKSIKQAWRIILYYVPGGIIALLFLGLHYNSKGWIVYHKDSPWAICFEKVDLAGFIRNIGIYAWRLIDFGKIIFWIVALAFFRKMVVLFQKDILFKKIVILLLLFLFILPINMLTHKYLTQHRYFLPVYFMFSLVVLHFLVVNQKKYIQIICIVTLILGNFIPYPDTIARGWDSTISYLPYNRLRNDALQFVDLNNIPPQQIKSWFPNLSSRDKIDLNGIQTSFSDQPLDSCRYCFYSNVYNDITDSEYSELKSNWKPIYTKQFFGVEVEIYQNPK